MQTNLGAVPAIYFCLKKTQIVVTSVFSWRIFLSLESSLVETETRYQCGHCDSMFITMDDVQQHMMELHMDSGVKVIVAAYETFVLIQLTFCNVLSLS